MDGAYALRLQYRVGTSGQFQDVTDAEGAPVAYERSTVAGDFQRLGPVALPASVEGQRVLQLRWVYHRTATGPDDGARDELRLDDIRVSAEPAAPELRLESGSVPGRAGFVVSGALAGAGWWLQSSTDLVNWANEAALSGVLDGRGTIPVNLGVADRGRFFRLWHP